MHTHPSDSETASGSSRANHLRNIAGVFLKPRLNIPRLALEKGYWLPILILSISMGLLRLVMLPELKAAYEKPEMVQEYAEQRGITEPEAQKELNLVRGAMPLFLVLEAPVIVILGVAGIGIIILLVGRLSTGIKVPFRQNFALVAWASLVGAIPLLLNVPLQAMNPNWVLPSNPGVFFSANASPSYFQSVLTSLDVFLIWQAWLISLGYAGLYKVGQQRAVGTIGTIFVIFIVLNALISSSAK